MDQCQIIDGQANRPCISLMMETCSSKISQENKHESRFYSNSYLPEDYFSYDKAVSFFRQGITDKPPGGLINVGYNCYMNAAIQCLAYTPGFQQFCLSMPNIMYEKNKDGEYFLD